VIYGRIISWDVTYMVDEASLNKLLHRGAQNFLTYATFRCSHTQISAPLYRRDRNATCPTAEMCV